MYKRCVTRTKAVLFLLLTLVTQRRRRRWIISVISELPTISVQIKAPKTILPPTLWWWTSTLTINLWSKARWTFLSISINGRILRIRPLRNEVKGNRNLVLSLLVIFSRRENNNRRMIIHSMRVIRTRNAGNPVRKKSRWGGNWIGRWNFWRKLRFSTNIQRL